MPAACQQAAGIRDIAINGKRKVSVRNSLTTVAERCVRPQTLPQRQHRWVKVRCGKQRETNHADV
ncbi:hypothetical protein O5286_28475, partial [Escherichia coli]|nr:hypothetical protein [Escherichia coli]